MTEHGCCHGRRVPSLRERRKKETAQFIQEALVALLREKDFGQITAEEISQRAGISLRTFFNYYPNKEAALLGPTNHIAEWLQSLLTERRGTLMEDLYRMHCEIGGSLYPHREYLGLLDEVEKLHPKVAQLRAASLASCRAQMTRALQQEMPGLDAMTCAICAQALIETGIAAVKRWLQGEVDLMDSLQQSWACMLQMTEVLSGRLDCRSPPPAKPG